MKIFCRILFCIVTLSWTFSACRKEEQKPDYRGEMRKFVEKISRQARAQKPGFIVVPQNGLELLTSDGTAAGAPETAYIQSIDGVGQEELWYGYDNNDNIPTPEPDHSQLLGMCSFARDHGLKVMVTDYCNSAANVTDSYNQNYSRNFISLAADRRDLDQLPAVGPPQTSNAPVNSLQDAHNFLYLISPSNFSSKSEFISAIDQSPYDVMILDLFFDENTPLDTTDLARLRTKPNGGTRKIICYMSIGEAESYRWYWKPVWSVTPPSFIVAEDPDWLDNYAVKYWDPAWQNIICSGSESYLQKAIDAGFDGVYLDLVSEYEYFEQ